MTVAAILLCDDSSGNMLSYPTVVDKANSLLDRANSCLPLLESSGSMAEKCAKLVFAIGHYIRLLRMSLLIFPNFHYFLISFITTVYYSSPNRCSRSISANRGWAIPACR